MMRKAWPAGLLALLLVAAFLFRPSGPARPAASPSAVESATPKPAPEAAAAASAPSSSASVPASADEPAPPANDVCFANLRRLLNSQNPDGSWGDGTTSIDGVLIGKTGITGLVLTAMMGAGYSHLSKDMADGLCMGDAVRNGLRWLMKDQREDGMFRSSLGGHGSRGRRAGDQ